MIIPFISDLFKSATDGLDKLFTSDKERLEGQAVLEKLSADVSTEITKMQSELMKADAAGNKLQRSWRPILMLGFGGVIILILFLNYLVYPIIGLFRPEPISSVPLEIWEIIQWVMSACVLGRSGEKIFTGMKKK